MWHGSFRHFLVGTAKKSAFAGVSSIDFGSVGDDGCGAYRADKNQYSATSGRQRVKAFSVPYLPDVAVQAEFPAPASSTKIHSNPCPVWGAVFLPLGNTAVYGQPGRLLPYPHHG